MTTVHITLPDQLAQDAQNAGFLSPARLEQWLREQLKVQRVDELFTAMGRMSAVDEPAALSPEKVAAEIAAMRRERPGRGRCPLACAEKIYLLKIARQPWSH